MIGMTHKKQGKEKLGKGRFNKCSICEVEIYSKRNSNNAFPVAYGRCCNHCNKTKVLSARIDRLKSFN
jgi:RNA polymerase-binding transcription factor DksA